MLHLVKVGLRTLASAFKARRDLALENLALRQQLAVLKHKKQRKRPKLSQLDRLFSGNPVQDLQEL